MTILESLKYKHKSNTVLKHIGKVLADDEGVVAIAEWLHYDLTNPNHVEQFLAMAWEVRENGYYSSAIKLEEGYLIELEAKGYYSDLPYGNWHKNIIEFFNTDDNSDFIDEYFESWEGVEHTWKEKGAYNVTSLIITAVIMFIEGKFYGLFEKEISDKYLTKKLLRNV